jgi:hypothetical protein
MNQPFPRTTVGGVSLPRMIMGTNWILGYSHTSAAADALINTRNRNRDSIAEIAEVFLNNGIDAVMAPIADNPVLMDGLKLAEDRTGKGMIRIDTPVMNVDDNADARKAAEATVKASKAAGCVFCFPHHSSAEQLVNKNLQAMPRLPDYLKMIRDQGMIPGLSAHMPELIIYSDANTAAVETYIQIYNCRGFLMQIEVEFIHRVTHGAKKPVTSIKAMAAGRCSPFVGISFSYATLRDCDMVTVGCLTAKEAEEDIEIGRAAIERRVPIIGGRSSPKKTEIMKEVKGSYK